MTSPQAILTGAVLIAAAVILSNGSEAVSQPGGAPGTYMVAASDGVAYVLDTATGSIRSCERQPHGRHPAVQRWTRGAVSGAGARQPGRHFLPDGTDRFRGLVWCSYASSLP